uniref:Uncharacterized protein n=1 Tax=Caenorhabditis tropicalis TaxID=1561998 RepID=A0A1I7U9U6_9PELO
MSSLRSDSVLSASEIILRVDDLKNKLINLDSFVHGHVDFRHKFIRYSAPPIIKKWPMVFPPMNPKGALVSQFCVWL